jgi:hypothetical protein
MADDRDVKFKATFEDDGAKKGFDEISESAKKAGESAGTASEGLEKAGEGLKSAGEGAEELGAKLKPASDALDQHGEKSGHAAKQSAEFHAATHLATEALGPLGGILRSLTHSQDDNTASLAKGILQVAAVGGAAGAAVQVLLHLKDTFEAIGNAGTFLGDVYTKLTVGADAVSKKEDEAAKKVAEHDAKMREAADAAATLERANAALAAGLIKGTDDTKLLIAQELSREALLHRLVDVSKEYAESLKAIGITVLENTSTLQAKEQTFFNEYERLVQTKGIEVANRWATAHKDAIQGLIDESETAGAALVPGFEKMATTVQIFSKALEDARGTLTDLAGKISDTSKELDKERAALAENTQKTRELAAAKIQASDEAYSAVSRNIDAEIAKLEGQRRAGEINDREYADNFAKLQGEQVDARRKRDSEIDKLNAAADKDVDEEEKKANEQINATIRRLDKEMKARKDAVDQEALLQEEQAKLQDDYAEKEINAGIARSARFKDHIAAYGQIADAAKAGLGLAGKQLDELATKAGVTTKAVKELYTAIAGFVPGAESGTATADNPGGIPVTPGGI